MDILAIPKLNNMDRAYSTLVVLVISNVTKLRLSWVLTLTIECDVQCTGIPL